MDEIKNLLLRSYDAPLSEEEKQQLARVLAASAELRKEKETIERMRRELRLWKADFAPGFTGRILSRVSNKTPFAFQSVFRVVALSGIAAIVLTLLSVYFIDGSLSLDTLLGINGYAPALGMLSLF